MGCSKSKPEVDHEAVREVAEVFAGIEHVDEMLRFLDEIFTPSERRDLALRWQLLKRLSQGVSQRQIAEALGVSLCKITRGSRVLKDPQAVTSRLLRRR